MTIVEFLLARIAEDEAGANERPTEWWSQRLLRECRAKRRIVELHQSWPVLVQQPPEFEGGLIGDPDSVTLRMSQRMVWLTEQEYRTRFGDEPPSAPMLRALAAIWADHPDHPDYPDHPDHAEEAL